MIPNKANYQKNTTENPAENNSASFSVFDIGYFLKKIIKAWYWFVIAFIIGYVLSFFYTRYYIQQRYSSSITLSISNNTASMLTPNQSINFIWGQGGSEEGIHLKKLILSRSHNEFLVKKLKLYVNYSTKGLLKYTFLDKNDSPVFVEVDENYPQQVGLGITLFPKGKDVYEIALPEEGLSNSLYHYKTETFHQTKPYSRPNNQLVKVGQWYQSPNLKFRLIKNPHYSGGNYENIVLSFSTINQKVSEIISQIGVDFDVELKDVMYVSKVGYNLNGTVSFLNSSIEELIEKRMQDQQMVDRNTDKYLKESLAKLKLKMDSAAVALNNIKIQQGRYDLEEGSSKAIDEILDLEKLKVELLDKIEVLNVARASVASVNLNNLINLSSAGIPTQNINSNITDLKALYAKKREMASIYTPDSQPMIEINRQIAELRQNSNDELKSYYSDIYKQIENIDAKIDRAEQALREMPEKQRQYFDIKRGYDIIENNYKLILGKQAETQIRMATIKSDISIIDPAKNLGQGQLGTNAGMVKMVLILGLLSIPLVIIALRVLLDTKVRRLKELLQVTNIPLLGTIGKNQTENNLVVIKSPRSIISESFRAIRANLPFLYKEDNRSKVILITSSISGEGKTFISINIASILALGGKKTILLGMDLRKPKIFGDFNIANDNGVSNYLTTDIDLKQVIKKTEVPDLDVITAGPIPPNPSELLLSDKNKELIQILRREYDFIVIDSPPVGLVADSFSLMKYADLNIYVARYQYTEKYMLKTIMDKYNKKEVTNLGLIFNGYEPREGYGYGYGYGYGDIDETMNYQEPLLIRIKNKLQQIFKRK